MAKRRRGFTLIELLVVIAIISLLISLLLANWAALRAAVDRGKCGANIRGLGNAYMSYVSSRFCNGNFPSYWAGEYLNGAYQSGTPMIPNYRIVDASKGAMTFSVGFGPLVFHEFVRDAETFICPAVRDPNYEWWHTAPDKDSIYFHGIERNYDPMELYKEWMKGNRVSSNRPSSAAYCLRQGLFPSAASYLEEKGVTAIIADNFHFHYADEAKADKDVIYQRHVSGVNVYYIDGHVEFRQDDILFTGNFTGPAAVSTGGAPTGTKMWAMWSSFDKR
jgi:prepilin-type N-terminal cleavage/methylation domain-containing protein/prepilin-type processing-associated H-X9-DG protein